MLKAITLANLPVPELYSFQLHSRWSVPVAKRPFSMMSQPTRKPGIPQGLERPDRTMEFLRPALLGGPAAPAASPRMAVYILGEDLTHRHHGDDVERYLL